MSDFSPSIPPECIECKEEFTTLWSINDVTNHFNNHLLEYCNFDEKQCHQCGGIIGEITPCTTLLEHWKCKKKHMS